VVALKTVRDTKQFQYLAQQVYPEDSGSLYNAYLNATSRTHVYLISDPTQDTNDGLRFRTSIFPSEHPPGIYSDIGDDDETCEIELSNPPSVENGVKRKAIISHCDKDLMKCISECALNVFNGNLPCDASKLRKPKVALLKFSDRHVSFSGKKGLIVQRGGFLLPLLSAILPSIVGILTSQ
jgi:hypothetical protein